MASSLTLLCLLVVIAAVAAKPNHRQLSPEAKERFEKFKAKMEATKAVCLEKESCSADEVDGYFNSTKVAHKNKQEVPEPTGCVACVVKCFMVEKGSMTEDGKFVVPSHVKDEATRQEIQDCYDKVTPSGDQCKDAVEGGKCLHKFMKKHHKHGDKGMCGDEPTEE